MGINPDDPPPGVIRVVRLHSIVTEALVTTNDPVAAVALAKALPPTSWSSRRVKQASGEDSFEYDAVHPAFFAPPLGFVFLIDTDGAYLIDTDGAYLMEAA